MINRINKKTTYCSFLTKYTTFRKEIFQEIINRKGNRMIMTD